MHANIEYLLTQGWKGKESRGQMTGSCPHRDHKDKNPSFSINEMTGAFNCFACKFRGASLVTLMMGVEGLSYDQAREKVYGPADTLEIEETPQTTYGLIMSHCDTWFRAALRAKKEPLATHAKAARQYLNARRVTDEMMDSYGMGLSGDGVVPYLSKHGLFNETQNLTAMLTDNTFICGNRVTVPVTHRGKTIGFSMRTLDPKNQRKYLNLINPDLYPCHRWFFGLDRAQGDSVYVTEGVFDAIAVGGIAMLGTTLSPERIALLHRFKTIYLMFDNDAGGWKAVEDFFFFSRGVVPKSVVMVCDLPKDPDEIGDSIGYYVETAIPITHWIARHAAKAMNPEALCNDVRRLLERAESCYEMNDIEKELLKQYVLTECVINRFAPKLWGGSSEWTEAWSKMCLTVEEITGIPFRGVK